MDEQERRAIDALNAARAEVIKNLISANWLGKDHYFFSQPSDPNSWSTARSPHVDHSYAACESAFDRQFLRSLRIVPIDQP